MPTSQAKQAYARAKSRVKTSTKANLHVKGFNVGKVLKSSQRQSAIYAASKGRQALVAKVYINDGADSFHREVAAHAGIGAHPHITEPVKIEDYTENESSEHAGILLFPRYVRSCADLLCEDGPLPSADVLEIAGHIREALEHTHEKGFVHCDVKPGNIMLNASGQALLIDLASAVKEGEAVVESTSHYALGLHVGVATIPLDFRCLAVTMFELLTGRIPASLDQLMTEFTQVGGECSELAMLYANHYKKWSF